MPVSAFMASAAKPLGARRSALALVVVLASTPGVIPASELTDAATSSAPFVVDASYLSRHDIVFQQPMQLEAEGFPLGNGDMGGLIWSLPEGVEFQINKNDIWSRPESGNNRGSMATPRHCARVKVDFGMPVFSWIHHLNDFEGRFSLARGEAGFSANTGFSKAKVSSWLAQDKNIWVLECDNVFRKETVEGGRSLACVSLERLGSRAFAGWYSGNFSRNPEAGIGETDASVAGRDLLLEETGDGMNFAVACRVLGGTGERFRRNSHRAEALVEEARFTLLVSVVTKAEADDPKARAIALLDQAEGEGVERLKAEKDAWFASFWARSFLKLGDDYLENIFYLRRYLMGIGSRGKYPVVFNGGLWRWNRDVINWMTPHHWNMQQQYWGLCAANDCDLMLPYLNTYFEMMPGMADLATTLGGVPRKKDAILLAEMHNFDGVMVDPRRADMRCNFTPAAQVALRFFEYWEYTGDKGFLAEKAYPFMKKAANFYLDKLAWNSDKRCFEFRGSVFEDGGGRGPALNPLSDRNCIEALFTSCIRAATILDRDRKLILKWRNVLDHLWERRLIEERDVEGPVIAACDEAGKYSARDWSVGGSIAFPEGIIGIDDAGTPFGKAAMNLIRSLKGSMYSHHPVPIIAARMGDGDEALKLLKDGISEMQYFPQGLFFNCRGYPSDLYNVKLQVNLLGGSGHPQLKWRDFFQCGMETISICGTAMQEMLLQSNEGKIRVFPAIPSEWRDAPLAFKLLARGGFLVASERRNGSVGQVGIQSRLGGKCRLQNPWPGHAAAAATLPAGEVLETTIEPGDVVAFETRPGTEYVVRRQDSPPGEAAKTVYSSEPNQEPKVLNGRRTLGLGKGFFVEK